MESLNNNYSNIGHVTVEKWNSKKLQDEKEQLNNDCYWNIAQNSLDVGASNEEITQVMNEIIKLNASEDSSGVYNTQLSADDVVLMPVKKAILDINSEINLILDSENTNEVQKEQLLSLKNTAEILKEEYEEKTVLSEEQNIEYQETLNLINDKILQKQKAIENSELFNTHNETAFEALDLIDGNKEKYEALKQKNEEAKQESSQLLSTDSDLPKTNVNKTNIVQFLKDDTINSSDLVSLMQSYNDKYGSLVNFLDVNMNKKDRMEFANKMSKVLDDEIQKGNKGALNLLCCEVYNSTAGRTGTSDEFIQSVIQNCSDETLVKMMDSYSDVSGSEIYKDIENDFSGKTQNNYLEKLDGAYKNVSNREYDGWNDGKLSIEEKTLTYADGLKENIKETAHDIFIENGKTFIIGTAIRAAAIASGALAAVAASTVGSVALAGIGIVAVGSGIVKGVKTIGNFIKHNNELKNAKTDEEAKQGIDGFADDTKDTVSSAISIYGGSKVVGIAKNGIQTVSKAGQVAQKAEKSLKQMFVGFSKMASQVGNLIKGGSGLSKVAMDSVGTLAQVAAPRQPRQDEQTEILEQDNNLQQLAMNDENTELKEQRKRPPRQ